MKLHGIDFQNMRVLVDMLDAIDCEFFMKCEPPSPPHNTKVTYYSDIRVAEMTDSEIHLLNLVGWKSNNDGDFKGGGGQNAEALYECRIPLNKLLDVAVPKEDRVKLVKWVKTDGERVEVMEMHGVDLQEMRAMVVVIDAIDAEWYLSLLPNMPKSENATHWSDIRVVSLDENMIHLSNRVGWSIGSDADIEEEWKSEIRVYEAKIPPKQLLDDTLPLKNRGQLVRWVQTEIERVSKRHEIQNGQDYQRRCEHVVGVAG